MTQRAVPDDTQGERDGLGGIPDRQQRFTDDPEQTDRPAADAARRGRLSLYLRPRGGLYVPLGLGLVGVLSYALAYVITGGGRPDAERSFIVVTIWAPVAVAVLVGVTLHAPMLDIEQTASRPMRLLLAGHLAALILVGALVLLPSGSLGGGVYGTVTLTRNLAGIVGIGLFAAPFAGGRLSWAVVTLYAVAVNSIGPNTSVPVAPLSPQSLHQATDAMTTNGVVPALWAWPLRQANDAASARVAVGLFLAGVFATILQLWRAQRPPDIGGG